MRIALLSDIHGNLVALETVLADLAAWESVDRIICLGDVAADGPRPRDVLQVLRELDAVIVKGNADDHLLNGSGLEQPHRLPGSRPSGHTRPRLPWVGPINRWGADQLTEDDRRFMDAFLPVFELPLGQADRLLCYHGSPRHWSDNVLPTTSTGDLDDWFASTSASIYAGGHTHEQMLRLDGRRTIMNPGSIGAPVDQRQLPDVLHFLPWAEYAVLEVREDRVEFRFRQMPVDRERLEVDARSSGMPYPEEWLGSWQW